PGRAARARTRNERSGIMSEHATSQPRPEATAHPGHDRRGRFTLGNELGLGNPFARQVAILRQTLLDALTPEDLIAVMQALIAKAKTGDVAATKLLLAYGLGKPAPTVDPDRLDVAEGELFRQEAKMIAELPKQRHVAEGLFSVIVARLMRQLSTEKYWAVLRGKESCHDVPRKDKPPSPPGSNGGPAT